MNNISKAGIGAIIGALGSLLPGAGWGSAIGGISGVITGGNFKHGRVFVVRGFVYQYYYLQWYLSRYYFLGSVYVWRKISMKF